MNVNDIWLMVVYVVIYNNIKFSNNIFLTFIPTLVFHLGTKAFRLLVRISFPNIIIEIKFY